MLLLRSWVAGRAGDGHARVRRYESPIAVLLVRCSLFAVRAAARGASQSAARSGRAAMLEATGGFGGRVSRICFKGRRRGTPREAVKREKPGKVGT